MRLFSTEQVSRYHPDKFADQISDAILDKCLSLDKNSRVACETMVKGSTVILAGEITTRTQFNYGDVVQKVAQKLGYKVDQILTCIDTQSPEIAGGIGSGIDTGAGDQGMMYGYACRETESMLPFGFDLANRIIAAIEQDVVESRQHILTGDAKCQVTVDLDAPPDISSVKKVLISACSNPDFTINAVYSTLEAILRKFELPNDCEIILNPAGLWTIGGPAADCGLTGRKIVCDQYGGYCPVGGGAFSGKDPSKVDRSGAYMARKIACDLLQKYDLRECEVQLAYAIGMAQPMSICVKTKPTNVRATAEDISAMNEVAAEWVTRHYDLTPRGIIKALNLHRERYETLAEGCHYRIGGVL